MKISQNILILQKTKQVPKEENHKAEHQHLRSAQQKLSKSKLSNPMKAQREKLFTMPNLRPADMNRQWHRVFSMSLTHNKIYYTIQDAPDRHQHSYDNNSTCQVAGVALLFQLQKLETRIYLLRCESHAT